MHHLVVDHWTRRASPLHRAGARIKIIAFLALLFGIAVTSRTWALAAYASLVLALVLLSRLPVPAVLLRASYVLPFAATFAVVSALAGDTQRAVLLIAKSFLSANAALLLVGTTPLPKLLAGFERLGAPRYLVMVIQFLYRYLFVIAEQAQHMRLAAACRGSLGRAGFRAAAGAVGVLFARSYARAEEIHNAMLSRGFEQGPCDAAGCGSPLVEVKDLRYRYEDGTLALDGVDFTLAAGETVAVFGPNGSGKTTFVLHLNGLLSGDGAVTVCGMPVERGTLAEIRRKVGMVFQDSDAQLFMPTVLEDVAFGPANQGMDAPAAETRAREALRRTGMEHAAGKAPYHLSAGEKRRVALAGVLATDPEVLVLDEPTTYLDPPAVRELIALLAALPQAKIVVTHDALFARAVATRAVFFRKGVIADSGAVDEVIARHAWDPRGE